MGIKHSLAVTAAGIFLTVPLTASAADIFYSGRATGIDGQITVANTPAEILIGDTGMSCQGLPHDETVAGVSNPSPLQVKSGTIHVHTLGKDGKAAADATIQSANLAVPGLTITADSIGAHAAAVCDVASGTVTATGHSDLANVVVNGQAIDPKVKQQISIPNVGYVYFDQHRHYSNEMRVFAIHVKLDNAAFPASGDIYLGEVRAKTICNP
jgi:hypothetical protein